MFIRWSAIHFEINILNYDGTDVIIPNYLSSITYQNEWAV